MAISQLPQKIQLTDIQIQVLNGALLGDGSLILHKNGKNAQLSYTSKSKQHVEFVMNYFKKYWSSEGLYYSQYLDSRTNKYYSSYRIRTFTNECFTDLYYNWYKDGIKIIPNNLTLTPLTCLIWYIGDGGIIRPGSQEYIKLATQCFNKQDQERILLPQLAAFNPTLVKGDISKITGEQQYFIRIPHIKEQEFLTYLGNCPFEDYLYKWQYTPYKNKLPKEDYSKYENEFCTEYLKGKTYYQIAKEYKTEPNTVKYYLIKNNLYKKETHRNDVIAIDPNTLEYINIYPSGAEASRQMNICTSAISQVCNKKRKTANGLIWEKYKNLSKIEQEQIQNKFKDYFIERS